MRWPFVWRVDLELAEKRLLIQRSETEMLLARERTEHARAQARVATNAYDLIVSASHVVDAAANLPELDGWKREHINLEAALGELVAALGPFAVTVRRAKAQRRPA